MDKSSLNLLFIGIGAIGGSVGAWVSQHHPNTFLLARGATADAIAARGLTLYPGDHPEQRQTFPVRVIRDLSEAPDPDVVVLAMKLYDLDAAARRVKEAIGDRAVVVGLQNGIANQTILPVYFSRVIYGIATYNAWKDAPDVIGTQPGALVLGTPDNSLQSKLETIAAIFNQGIATQVTQHLADVVHSKIAINLGNSVTTLLGIDLNQVSDLDLYQTILSNTIYEGVQVIRAAGYHEESHGGLPSWRTIWAAAKLPHLLTRGLFRRNLNKMRISSMGQDIFMRGSAETELEYLNGYVLQLADQTGVPVPYNRAIYRLCKERFARPGFRPMDVKEVAREINH